MIAGNPDKFAIITEKVANWRSDDNVSGMVHVCVNGVAYPRKPRATDVDSDICSLYDEEISAFPCPRINRKLFAMKGKKLFKRLRAMRFPQYNSNDRNADEDRRFDVVLNCAASAGYHVFVISDGQNVRLLIGRRKKKKHGGRLRYIDSVTISAEDYRRTVNRLFLFYRGILAAPESE